MHMFIAREMEEGDVPKEETLGDYLQEYESQSQRFKDHLKFQGFFKIKEHRRPSNYNRSKRCKQHELGRLFIYTFYGSPKCTTRAWVKELDTYLQQHQVLEDESIRVAALHLEGKAYAWWFYETSSLNHVKVATYAKFTKRLVKIFDVRSSCD